MGFTPSCTLSPYFYLIFNVCATLFNEPFIFVDVCAHRRPEVVGLVFLVKQFLDFWRFVS